MQISVGNPFSLSDPFSAVHPFIDIALIPSDRTGQVVCQFDPSGKIAESHMAIDEAFGAACYFLYFFQS